MKIFNKQIKRKFTTGLPGSAFRTRKTTTGFTIVEIVVVPAILLMIVLAVTTAFNAYIKSSAGSVDNVKASLLLEEGVEVMKIFRDESYQKYFSQNGEFRIVWLSASDKFGTTSDTTLIDGKFDRKITISDAYRDDSSKALVQNGGTIDSNTKKITVTVDWGSGENVNTKNFEAYIPNIFSN